MNRAKTKRKDGAPARGNHAAKTPVTIAPSDAPTLKSTGTANLTQGSKKSSAADLDAVIKEKSRLDAKNQELRSAIDQRFAEIAKLTEMLMAAEKTVQEHKDEIARITAENVVLKKKIADAALRVHDDRTRALELDSTNGKYQKLLTEVDALKAVDAQRLDELAALSARLDNERILREKYEHLLSSQEKNKAVRLNWRLPKFKRSQTSQASRLTNALERIRSSQLFDANWYLEKNPDVRAGGIDPAEHYLKFGADEGRDPGPLFNTKYYSSTNSDVAEAKINPLLHYIDHGHGEGRSIKSAEGK